MKKYSKFIWISVFILIVVSMILHWDDVVSGMRDGFNGTHR